MLKFIPILLISMCVLGGDDLDVWNKHKDGLYQAAKAYVKEFSTEKDWQKWNENIKEKLETRSLETVALDWFVDNRADLEDKIPSAIVKACFFFIKFVDTNTLPPASIRNNITEQNMLSLQNYLERCVEEVSVSCTLLSTYASKEKIPADVLNKQGNNWPQYIYDYSISHGPNLSEKELQEFNNWKKLKKE